MTWVKVCGITCLEDALVAAEAGADAVGFIFADSPRRLSLKAATGITRHLPANLERVGVFVRPSAEEVQQAVEVCGLTTVQLHGPEPPEFCAQMPVPVIKGFRVRGPESLALLPAYRGLVRAMLLDAFVPGQVGGTGKRLDLSLVRKAKQHGDIIVAGGISGVNVAEVITAVRPWGVDASTGLCSTPLRKDPRLVRDYIAAARRADAT
jgi:phosphoribosylanthranilate isomerase